MLKKLNFIFIFLFIIGFIVFYLSHSYSFLLDNANDIDSLHNQSINSEMVNKFESEKEISIIISLLEITKYLFPILLVIQGFITYLTTYQLRDARQARKNVEEIYNKWQTHIEKLEIHKKELNDQMKKNLIEFYHYLDFIQLQLNQLLPNEKKFKIDELKYLVKLKFGEKDERGYAIQWFRENGSINVIPYLERIIEIDEFWCDYAKETVNIIKSRIN